MTEPRKKARELKVGLALGSGAARGWAHIGVIETLIEAGIPIDMIAGSSMGALIGAAHAAGRLAALHEWALNLTWRGIVRLLDVHLSEGGLIRGEEIVHLLETLGIHGAIESLPLPFLAVATDLVTGREIWLREGELTDAVRASIAIPGIFSPWHHGREWLLDGGLVNPVPVSACRAMGADVIIAVNLNGDLVGSARFPVRRRREVDPLALMTEHLPESMQALMRELFGDSKTEREAQSQTLRPGYFDVLASAINIMQDQITRARLAGEPPHVLISPRLADFELLDFDRAETAIAEGRRATEHLLSHIEHVLTLYERGRA